MTINRDETKGYNPGQSQLQKLKDNRFLLFSLVASCFAILIAEQFGKNVATSFSDWLFLPVPGALVILSLLMVRSQGLQGDHGKAWISFALVAICWFTAEQIWTFEELFLHSSPFPSDADFFYLAGYPAYFVFSILYLKQVRKAISKKMIVSSIFLSVAVLIPNLYMTLDNSSGEDQFAIALGALYPIADAIILVPAVLGVALFLGGKVNFLWTLLLFGVLLEVVGDTSFQYFTLNNTYYSGHPVDIIYLWGYIVFSFGVYDYLKTFKKEKDDHRFIDQEKMR